MEVNEFKVGMLSYKIIAWVTIILFSSFTILSYLADQANTSPFFLIFVIMGAFMLLTASSIKFNETSITVYSPIAKYRLNWNEVDYIEFGNQGVLVFHGLGNKRLVLPSASVWSGPAKPKAYEFMCNIIEKQNINIIPSNTADFKIHKNVKVNKA